MHTGHYIRHPTLRDKLHEPVRPAFLPLCVTPLEDLSSLLLSETLGLIYVQYA
jgi:hypothetical protein